MNDLKRMTCNAWLDMRELEWMNWNKEIQLKELKWTALKEFKWTNWSEWTEVNELKWRTWHEGIEMSELKWMNWDEWIDMNELKWMTWDEWIGIKEWKRIDYFGDIWNRALATVSRTFCRPLSPLQAGARGNRDPPAATTDGHFTRKNTGWSIFKAWIHAFPAARTSQLLHDDVVDMMMWFPPW